MKCLFSFFTGSTVLSELTVFHIAEVWTLAKIAKSTAYMSQTQEQHSLYYLQSESKLAKNGSGSLV